MSGILGQFFKAVTQARTDNRFYEIIVVCKTNFTIRVFPLEFQSKVGIFGAELQCTSK